MTKRVGLNVTAPVRLLVLLIGLSFVPGDSSFAQADQKCSDPKPSDPSCVAVQPLRTINGCACFVCYPESGKQEQSVCTTDRRLQDWLLAKPRR